MNNKPSQQVFALQPDFCKYPECYCGKTHPNGILCEQLYKEPSQQQPVEGEKRIVHELKTHAPFYGLIVEGKKTFEVRRNDRNYRTGDILHLKEWDMKTFYTGRECFRTVTYILHGGEWGIHPDYCVMGLSSRPTVVGEEELERDIESATDLLYDVFNEKRLSRESIKSCISIILRKYREQGGEEVEKAITVITALGNEIGLGYRDLEFFKMWECAKIKVLTQLAANNKKDI